MGFLVYQDYDMRTYALAALAALFCSPASAQVDTFTAVPSAPASAPVICDASYPGATSTFQCPPGSQLNFTCWLTALNQHEQDWLASVKSWVDAHCELVDELALMDFQIQELQNTIDILNANIIRWTPLCDAGDLVVCNFINGLELEVIDAIDQQTQLGILAVYLQISVNQHEDAAEAALAVIDATLDASLALCCEGFQASEPKAMLVSMALTCDAQYPGHPPLPVLGAGLCYDTACVNAAKAAHEAYWDAVIKDGRDLVCELQESADYWNGQAFYYANLAAQMIPLCYGGDLESCRLMNHYLAEEQEAIDQADAFEILVATYTASLDVDELDNNADFLIAILSCSYVCN
tara:strand:- start:3871 stop:4920 length:1050 start_codon:yes stop_codon:yes gene_type:complete